MNGARTRQSPDKISFFLFLKSWVDLDSRQQTYTIDHVNIEVTRVGLSSFNDGKLLFSIFISAMTRIILFKLIEYCTISERLLSIRKIYSM
ncbi:hypothetical protein ABF87_08925 [Nitrosomonas sp. JL21]|nr:hypothetical protein [Nitrosomonas sp. JL21]